jgi:NhaA family Na+:H+ antiporter
MALPALIHYVFNAGTPAQRGFGIPMATDIAFALGVLSLAGKRVPLALKVFLTALAIIDDLGAILIIAVFYTSTLQTSYLFAVIVIFLVLVGLNRLKVHVLWPYLLGGLIMWFCMYRSGVHATLTGVLLAFAIPFGDGGEKSPSWKLQHFLHVPVAFLIVPFFALANTGILLGAGWYQSLAEPNSLGIMGGLFIGKPLGILLACGLAVMIGMARLPEGVSWAQLAGAGILAGIGFTMSIFITLLAFPDPGMVASSKIAILLASLLAGVAGLLLVKYSVRNAPLEIPVS